jgi:hypothetical protein
MDMALATDDSKTKSWVLEQFLALNFTAEQAELMVERQIDHHTAKRFLDNGCTHELVVRILS